MKSIFYALLLGFSAMVYGQSSLKGKVTDENNQPVPNVAVSLPELHIETKTDSEGNYFFKKLAKGTFTILFVHEQFDEVTSTITLNKEETVFNTQLHEAHSHHIDEIMVSTSFNKAQKQNVMKVEHSSIKALQQKGAATLAEGLATIPGVANVSTGTSIGKPVIRGLSGNRVLVYTQGVRLENQQFGDEHGLGLSDNGIESVEVIKGPASLLYGSDALGGVLYFNPEKFAAPKSYSANLSQKYFSNTQGSTTSFGLKSSSDNWNFSVRGGYNTHSDYKTADGERVTNSRFNETDAKIALGYKNSKFSSVFRYNINDLVLGLPEEINKQTTTKTPDYPRQGVLGQIASLHNTFYLTNSKIEADFGYISNKRKEFEDSPVALLDMNLQTFNYDFKYFLPKFNRFETIFGVQGMHQTNENSGEELLIPNAETNDLGVLATTMYSWNKNAIQAGLRYDTRKIATENHGVEGEEGYFKAIDKNYQSFNASIGYKTSIKDNFTLRLNVASGFRAPNLAELTSNGVHEGSNRYEIGNSNLKNEQNVQADINLEYGTTHFEIFANSFYNHINNYIFISPAGAVIDDNNVYEYIQANAELFGGEIGLHIHPHPMDWLHITSTFESVTGKKDNGDYLPLIPANKFTNTFRANFDIKEFVKDVYLSAVYETNFNQKNISEFETETPSYSLLNLAAGGSFNLLKLKFDFSFNANNILNKTYISHLSRLKADGIPNIGRNLVFCLNFNF
ncbi:TonB-dependent receptor domain-containing protein [Flavobacterium sp. H122]|uniref:TonB-dependent receptor n=1 Tax=Flavobacterium sp. H122 TaxID=2529860 RepID=UPI0010AAE915|nr:TonB-dependent receptor [Flavobacterium sp. H122]